MALFLSVGVVRGQEIPRFEPGECPFEGGEWLEEETIDCGEFIVFENRHSDSGRTLRLAVAIVHSLSENPNSDPVVWLQGGPGGSTVSYMQGISRSNFWRALREERDLIFFDQRGTGYSEPHFCDELDVSLTAILYKGLPAEERTAERIQAIAECREEMLQQGIDFAAYNSAASAQDLADMRVVLGFEEWNLFGGSYGTRLALTAMRDAPEGVRSVIINATSPPNATRWSESLQNYERSLRLVFDQCSADPDCAELFATDVETAYFDMLDGLEGDPMIAAMADTAKFPGGQIILDGELMAAAVFQALYSESVIPFLPLLFREVTARNTDALMALADGIAPDPHRISQGFYYSVECYEVAPFSSPEAIEAARARNPRLAKLDYYVSENVNHELCAAWHLERAGAIEVEAVVSDIPTLIMAGEFDPITPPRYGRLAGETLSNSYYSEARAAGHGAGGSECLRGVYNEFLDDPMRQPDFSCVEEREAVAFVTDVHINGGIYRLGSAIQGGLSLVESAWLAITMLVLLSAVLGWPLGYLVRRLRPKPPAFTGAARTARWVAGLASLLALGFVGGLTAVIMRVAADNPLMLGFGVPGPAGPLFTMPWLSLVLQVLVVAFALMAWRKGWWGRPSRVHYTLVTLGLASFFGVVSYWGLV
jgi:pimeloyl-ACP methyl ester carboxylesterase